MKFSRSSEWMLFASFAIAKLLVHLAGISGYGYFRDELYYLECARRLAWGYVDQPPLSLAILALTVRVAGASLLAVRIVPALFGAAMVWLTGMLTRDLGGGRFAQILAMVTMIAAPIALALGQYYSMNGIELFLWPLAAWIGLRAVERGRTRDWMLLGVVLGLGLLNKISMIWFAGGLGLGLVLTPARRALMTPGPWIAFAIAAVLFAPHVAWQVANGWPTLEFMHNAAGSKMVAVGALVFLLNQVLLMNPLAAPIWISGLVALLRSRRASERVQGVLFVAVAALIVVVGKSRASYLAPAYPVLIAAGAAAIERAFSSSRAWLRVPAIALVVAAGALLVPLTLPVLSESSVVTYLARLGIRGKGEEHHRYGALPQQYADMHGWPAMADTVARVFESLSPGERAQASIYAQNYGEAGAINFFRPDLPRCVSGHNNYWLWGPPPPGTTVMVILGGSREDHLRSFTSVDSVAMFHAPWVMPYEDSLGVFVGRGPRRPLAAIWPSVRSYE